MSTLHSGSSDTIAEITKENMQFNFRFCLVQLYALTFYTCCIAISLQRKPASTGFSVVPSCTISTKCAIAWFAKWLAFFSGKLTTRNKFTFFICITVSVLTTACFNACYIWISLKTWWANTNSCVIVYFTNSPGATLCS